ncbi:Importin-11, partial [Bulinus truncatus]
MERALESAKPLVLETLAHACSQNASVLKPAEQKLQQWETEPGFYSVLTDIFCNHEIDANVRWLAALYCKNGVDRYWRKSAPHAICEEEKEAIKKRLVSDFTEPVPQIATQIAVLTAKIARLDCPRNWDSLLPTLHNAVRCEEQLVQERTLLVLHHVTKTLASKRLAPDKKLFEELTQDVFAYMVSLWNSKLSQFFHLAAQHDEFMTSCIDRCRLILKVLRKQVSYGFKEVQKSPEAMNFISNLFPQLDALLDCRRSLWGHHAMLEKCEHLISIVTKVLLDLVEMHPISYVHFIKTTLTFVVQYNFTAKADEVASITIEANKIIREFFTSEALTEICRRLVSDYFLLRTEDLMTWEGDPEEFCQEEGGDSYKYSLRPCTETLFLTIFKAFRQSLSPVLLEMVQAAQGPCDPDNLTALLRKDAAYNAVGLASFDLFDDIDFDTWFTTHLLQELKVKNKSYRVIRRRVIWLIGQWVGVKMSVNLRPALYEAVIGLLDQNEDLAYIEPLFSLLFQLLKEVRECDTKMHVLHVLSFVIERVGSKIRPYISSLVQYLPLLWKESEDHNMLRCAILTSLVHLVQGYGSESTQLWQFILPAIAISTDTTQEPHVYLMEDGLELWYVTLINAPVMSPELLKLFDNMPALLGELYRDVHASQSVCQNPTTESTVHVTNAIFGTLLDTWTDKLDTITQPERRKLSALAMASLLSQNYSIITDHFRAIINCLVEVLHDICRVDEDGVMT